MARYRITIEKIEPYVKTTTVYQGGDGKNYENRYGIPEGVKYNQVEVPTGEMGGKDILIFTQDVEDLDLVAVIKAVNKIQ